jgi:hypothetical protein
VKFQVGTVKKRYMNNKHIYQYKRISLNIPKQFHKLVEPFLDKNLQMQMTTEKNTITITLNVTCEKP